jgi:mannose-6-phosphate isomerase
MNEPLFLEPVFKERIWGGTELKSQFGYEIPSDSTGEAWVISAHPNGQSKIKSGSFKGMSLGELWNENRTLFGNYKGNTFPLLTKILDANKDLSAQVHPDDMYAQENENGELGKTECWYVIDCKEDAEMVFGHQAKTREEFMEAANIGDWERLLRKVKVKPGDFFYVPSGTIHALCEGTLVLETQQNSDTTYRVYDYNRTDSEGNKRELHLDKAIEVATIPHVDIKTKVKVDKKMNSQITTYVRNEFFTVQKWDVNGLDTFKQDQPFLLVSVLEGKGVINKKDDSYSIAKGDHFILPNGFGDFVIEGKVQMIVSYI